MADNPTETEAETEEEFASIEELGAEEEEQAPEEPEKPAEGEEGSEESRQEEAQRKLAGKFSSPEELEKAYQELEKEKSRLGNEVGTLRREIDNYIVPQLQSQQQNSQQEGEEQSEEDFWDNPQKAIKQAVEERLQPVEQQLTQQQQQEAVQRLYSAHPDANEVAQSSEFQSWLGQNPKLQSMFQEADQKADADTASEILSIYKQMNQKQQSREEPTHDSESLKEASVENSKSQKTNKKKVFRRADLMQLQRDNPQRFKELWPEILKAYEEDRVK